MMMSIRGMDRAGEGRECAKDQFKFEEKRCGQIIIDRVKSRGDN
jgi:hypothetical protein